MSSPIKCCVEFEVEFEVTFILEFPRRSSGPGALSAEKGISMAAWLVEKSQKMSGRWKLAAKENGKEY